jgi:hypothetical protein
MRQFARYRHARRVKEVSVRERSGVRNHNEPELPTADHQAQDAADRGQVRQPRLMYRSRAGANACGPCRAGLRDMK